MTFIPGLFHPESDIIPEPGRIRRSDEVFVDQVNCVDIFIELENIACIRIRYVFIAPEIGCLKIDIRDPKSPFISHLQDGFLSNGLIIVNGKIAQVGILVVVGLLKKRVSYGVVR